MHDVGWALARAAALLGGVLLLYPPLAWLERWTSLPPGERERLGKHPFLPVTHALKLLTKRALAPSEGDGWVHALAPIFLLLPGLFVLAQLPPGPALVTDDRTLFDLAVTAGQGHLGAALGFLFVTPAGILLTGWAGGDRLAFLGGLRLGLVRISALVVVALACLGVARAHGTFLTTDLVLSQGQSVTGVLPALGVFTNPFGFGCALVAFSVLGQRGQRTSPDRNADLVEPYAVTARGPTLLAHRLFEVVDLLVAAALLTTIFLGGWLIPGLDEADRGDLAFVASRVAVFHLKALVVAGVLLVIRRALPPLRHAQALRLVWTVLVPLSVLGLAASGLLVLWLG